MQTMQLGSRTAKMKEGAWPSSCSTASRRSDARLLGCRAHLWPRPSLVHRLGILLAVNLAEVAAQRGLPYKLHDSYVSADFASKWDFWTAPDPSRGHVQYVDATAAVAEGLIRATRQRAYIGVERSSVTSEAVKRHSVRIQSKAVYNKGLFVIDVEHMPTGCGTWPAFWLYGEDEGHQWPTWGEYDIIEGVHNSNSVMTTLHTGAGCQQSEMMPGTHFTGKWMKGTSNRPATNCDINAARQWRNQGCSQSGIPTTAGQAFNARGGGTFAGEWDPEAGHIRTWFWPEGSVPPDLRSRAPRPESWGKPISYFSLRAGSCSPSHFRNMRLVLNVNLCGDLGDAVFKQFCPQEARSVSCRQLVSDPGRLHEAFWSIRGLDVYLRSKDYVIFADGEGGGWLKSWALLLMQRRILGIVLPAVAAAVIAVVLVWRVVVVKPWLRDGSTERMLVQCSSEEPFPRHDHAWGFRGSPQAQFTILNQQPDRPESAKQVRRL